MECEVWMRLCIAEESLELVEDSVEDSMGTVLSTDILLVWSLSYWRTVRQ